MITKFNSNPKNNTWKHENNIAHGLPDNFAGVINRDSRRICSHIPSNLNNAQEREPLKVKKANSLTFKGSLLYSGKLIKAIAKEFRPLEKKNSMEIYNKVKDYLDEPLRLAFEKTLKSFQDKTPDIVVTKPIYYRFCEALKSPIAGIANGIKYFFSNSQTKKAITEKSNINYVMTGLEGAYKKIIDLEGKPTDQIKKTLSEFLNRQLNSIKTNYSISICSSMVTLLVGVYNAFFVANDFSNLSRLTSDDPVQAKKEWKSKFKQLLMAVGLSAYLGYVTSTTFKQAVNSSLKFAVALNAINLAATQIISRKLTGTPILIQRGKASDKNPLNKYMESIGNNKENSPFAAFINNTKTEKAPQTAGSTQDNKIKPSSSVSFTGNPIQNIITSTIPREKLAESLEVLKKIDKKRYIDAIKTIKDEIVKSGIFQDQKISLLRMLKDNSYKSDITKIPTGKNGLYNFIVNIYNFITLPTKPFIALANKIIGKKATTSAEKPLKLAPVFVKNTLNLVDQAKKSIIGDITNKELIEKIKSDPALVNKLKASYGSFLTGMLSAEKAKYDSSKAGILFKLTGLTSVPFLVMDAYNLAKKETGDDEVATQKARERAAQDLTRQAFSTWIVFGFNNIFKEFFNNSLLGAALVATGGSLSYESLTRLSVGVPVLPKTKAELEEIDAKNFKKKGLSAACFRTMSRLTGKKPLSEQAKKGNKSKYHHTQLHQSLLLNPPKDTVALSQLAKNSNMLSHKSSFILNNSLVPDRFKTQG